MKLQALLYSESYVFDQYGDKMWPTICFWIPGSNFRLSNFFMFLNMKLKNRFRKQTSGVSAFFCRTQSADGSLKQKTEIVQNHKT